MGITELEPPRLQILTPSQRRWVEGHVVLGAPDLRRISTEELRTLFQRDKAPPGVVSVAGLLRTLVWQTWLLAGAGEVAPMHGNLRTFWYRVVEPFCLEHRLLRPEEGPGPLSWMEDNAIAELVDESELDHPSMLLHLGEEGAQGSYVLGAMGRILDHFVRERFFTFREPFDFRDPRENFHTMGARRPSLLFFTEKEGLWWLAQEIGRSHGISVMASHGEPGLLTLEYFARQLRLRGVANLAVGALTDYDPWGYAIAENFRKKLELPVFGFTVTLRRLTSLRLFTAERIAYSRRDLGRVSPNKRAQVNDWVRLTGGVDGRPFGLHVDNAEIPLIRQQVEAWLQESTPSARRKPGSGEPPAPRGAGSDPPSAASPARG